MQTQSIAVCTGDRSLGDILTRLLGPLAPGGAKQVASLEELQPQDLLVASTSRCSTAECAALSQNGIPVIVLAALPSTFESQAFTTAGAVGYLHMGGDSAPLKELVQGAVARSRATV
jgi:hypothetical protein